MFRCLSCLRHAAQLCDIWSQDISGNIPGLLALFVSRFWVAIAYHHPNVTGLGEQKAGAKRQVSSGFSAEIIYSTKQLLSCFGWIWRIYIYILLYYSIHTAGRLIRLLGLKFFRCGRWPCHQGQGSEGTPDTRRHLREFSTEALSLFSTRGTAGEPNAVRSLREWNDLHWFEGFGRASIHFIYIYIYLLISHWQLGFHWIDISWHFSPKLNLLRAHLKYPTGWQIIAMPPRDSEAWHELTALSFNRVPDGFSSDQPQNCLKWAIEAIPDW